MDLIDWSTAQRIGELIAGSPPPGGIRAADVEPLAHDYAQRVSAYSRLEIDGELPPLETVDRPAWIAANLESMRPLLTQLAERGELSRGLLGGPMQAVSGLLLGAQIGALTGLLSQRVLGQYDLALLDDATTPRLLLVAPNLAQAARTLAVDRDELVRWVTIHEITHAVQFSGAPWLRGYLAGILSELIEDLTVTLTETPRRLPRIPDGDALRELIARARAGELLRVTLGEGRWRLVERLQSAMSLVEGHAEHTMDAVGAEVLPSLPRLRRAMTHRRENRGLPWRVLERLLGLELKLRQYETGRRFCDGVVAAAGPEALALAWRSPEMLPDAEELADPARWLARVQAPAGSIEAG